jgi:uncharacterized protein (DUF58 family)
MSDLPSLFDEKFLHKIDRLSLVVRKRRAGQLKGERRSTKRGASVEFADYRDYTKGDDLRRVDWNIYARLERPFVKLFEEEEDLTVHLLLDASRSMDWPRRSSGVEDKAGSTSTQHNTQYHKWTYTQRTAAALGYIALGSGDRLTVALLREDADADPSPRFGPARGKRQILRLLRFLSASDVTGTTDLNHSLQKYAFTAHRPGLAILITDLFSPSGYQDGLSTLLARGYEAILLHVLAPEEANPRLVGDLKLVDVESGHEQEVTIDAGMRGLYRRRLAAWQDENNRWCGQRRVAYVSVVTDTPFDELILYHLRQRGLVR